MFEYKIEDHGCDHAQFFPGAGVAFTKFALIVTGSGSSAKEAGEDALEQFWEIVAKHQITVADMEKLEAEIKALSEEADAHHGCEGFGQDDENHGDCEWAHYVSIRWRY